MRRLMRQGIVSDALRSPGLKLRDWFFELQDDVRREQMMKTLPRIVKMDVGEWLEAELAKLEVATTGPVEQILLNPVSGDKCVVHRALVAAYEFVLESEDRDRIVPMSRQQRAKYTKVKLDLCPRYTASTDLHVRFFD